MKFLKRALLAVLAAVSITSCDKDNEVKYPEMKLSAEKLTIKEAATATFSIQAGSGDYSVTSSNEKVATVSVSNTKATVNGLQQGNANIIVRDRVTRQAITLPVVVEKSTPTENSVTLHFDAVFEKDGVVSPFVLSKTHNAPTTATQLVSAKNQLHRFKEVKYIISNIRLIKTDDTEVDYNVESLDNGAHIVNLKDPKTFDFVLSKIPAGEYKQIKFGLGVKPELNKLDEEANPKFYAQADGNDDRMHWEWGSGYRFVKMEGYFRDNNDTSVWKELSIHIGSTFADYDATEAYRDITLDLPQNINVGEVAPTININTNLSKVLSGKENLTLTSNIDNEGQSGNATPNVHHAGYIYQFVENMKGMFSVNTIQN
ncbi:MAG: hypothetical protein Q3983_02590 [Capnocytophaga sp.]|nr:hypothetical protein [Capnocytophaga sp.]